MAAGGGTLDSLERDLKKGMRPFYLFTCGQPWILSEAVSMLRVAMEVDPANGFIFGRMTRRSKWEDFEAPLRNYAFFDGPKLVQIEVDIDAQAVLPERLSIRLNSFLEEKPGPSALCLTSRTLKPLIAARNRIVKQGGLAVAFAEMKGKALEELARAHLLSCKVEFEPSLPAALVERLLPDPGEVLSEAEKLSMAVGPGGKITVKDLERLVPLEPDLSIFQLTEAIADGRPRRVIAVLADLLDSGDQDPVRLLSMLGGTMSNVLKARILLDQGLQDTAVLARLAGHPFAASKALAHAKRGTRKLFTAWILNLQKLDLRMKRVSGESRRIFLECYLLESMSGRVLPS